MTLVHRVLHPNPIISLEDHVTRGGGKGLSAALEMTPEAIIERVLASKVKEPLLVGFECFDLFRDPSGEKLPADRKSIAYRLHYRAADRTLKTEEIDAAHKGVVSSLTAALPVSQR